MEQYLSNSETRTVLMRKLMAICPVCGMLIFGRDIDLSHLDPANINHWPVSYTHCHSHKEVPMHALTLYLDSNFSVRGSEVSNYVKIQKK